MVRNTIASGVAKYAANSRFAMIQLSARLSRMAASRLGCRDEAEDVVELAALNVDLVDGESFLADGPGHRVGDRDSVLGQHPQPHLAVGRPRGLNPRDGAEMFESLRDGAGPVGR